jgi:hypothetical protein
MSAPLDSNNRTSQQLTNSDPKASSDICHSSPKGSWLLETNANLTQLAHKSNDTSASVAIGRL